MPKKIRFPLKLADGTQARTLEELREHFDLESVLGHYKNGKLLTWLEDRYLEGEAEAIRALDEAAPDFQRKLCEVFQVEYTGDDADMEAIQRRQERLKQLRTITDEPEFIDHIDQIAFNQEELADLLDEDESVIYLCGEKFTVPASRKGVTYTGINNPAVHISGKLPETAGELEITFRECEVDNLPSSPVENTIIPAENTMIKEVVLTFHQSDLVEKDTRCIDTSAALDKKLVEVTHSRDLQSSVGRAFGQFIKFTKF